MTTGVNNNPYANFPNFVNITKDTASPPLNNNQNASVSNKPAPSTTESPKSAPAQDTFEKRISNQEKTQAIKFLLSVAVTFLAIFGATKYANHLMQKNIKNAPVPQPPKNNLPDEKLKELWCDLTGATGIEDMALPKSLKTLTEKIKTGINNQAPVLERGGKPTKSILLYGPPGTGKTTFAKALAKMFPNSEFASLDITSLGSEYRSVSERNINAAVDAIIKRAKDNPDKKIFVFIDEIDSVMMVDSGSGAKYSNDILNEFKKCFTEKLGQLDNIITIGATNLEIDVEKAVAKGGKKLDKAMIDRFEQKVLVDLPTSKQIKQAITAHYKKCKLVSDELKKADSEKLDKLCDFLAKKEHNVSFRTLNSIYSDAATMFKDDTSKVTIDSLIEIIKKRASEFNINEEELANFLSSVSS